MSGAGRVTDGLCRRARLPASCFARRRRRACLQGKWRLETRDALERDPSQPWWKAFGDARLDALIDAANLANQDIHAAEAQYRQAQALVQNAQSALFPTLNGAAGVGTAAEPDRARPVARQFPLVVAAGGLGT